MKSLFLVSITIFVIGGLFVSCVSNVAPLVPVPSLAPSPSPEATVAPRPSPAITITPSPSPAVPAKKEVTKQITVQVPKLAKEEVSYPDGTLSQYTVYTYDAGGKLLKEEMFNQKKQLVLKRTTETSTDGLIQTISTTNASNELQGLVARVLDSRGLVLKESLMTEKKEVQSISEYSWDKEGNPLTWISSNKDQSTIVVTTYKVSAGKIENIVLADDKGTIIKRFDLTWNDQGQLTKKAEVDPVTGPVSAIIYHYDDKQLSREDYTKADGTTVRSIVYSYDEHKVPVQFQNLDRKGKVTEIHKQDFQFFSRTETITVME